MEEICLGILVNAKRNHVQHAGLGDFLDTDAGGLEVRQTEMVADERKWGFPLNSFNGRLGKVYFRMTFLLVSFKIG